MSRIGQNWAKHWAPIDKSLNTGPREDLKSKQETIKTHLNQTTKGGERPMDFDAIFNQSNRWDNSDGCCHFLSKK